MKTNKRDRMPWIANQIRQERNSQRFETVRYVVITFTVIYILMGLNHFGVFG